MVWNSLIVFNLKKRRISGTGDLLILNQLNNFTNGEKWMLRMTFGAALHRNSTETTAKSSEKFKALLQQGGEFTR
jgi:hypothetical protein